MVEKLDRCKTFSFGLESGSLVRHFRWTTIRPTRWAASKDGR